MLKKLIKNSFNLLGLNLSRRMEAVPSPSVHHNIDVILDVGANIGQYVLSTRKDGYKGKIVSFEPLPEAHFKLSQMAEKDALWKVHPRCAVGSFLGSTKINISKNSYSSSILPMLNTLSSAAPDSVYVGTVETSVITLDSIFDSLITKSERVFLKIDTQGFESEVLAGSLANIRKIKAVQLELSTVPLYEGQELYRYFFDFFEVNGFQLWSILPGFTNIKTGQLLQFDAIFVNQSL
jgi:FkbM family methyltransferase